MSTELQFNKYFASVQLTVLKLNGFVFKNQCRTQEPPGEQGVFSTYHHPEATCNLQSSYNSDCISILCAWSQCNSIQGDALHLLTECWKRCVRQNWAPELLWLHRAITHAQRCRENSRAPWISKFPTWERDQQSVSEDSTPPRPAWLLSEHAACTVTLCSTQVQTLNQL